MPVELHLALTPFFFLLPQLYNRLFFFFLYHQNQKAEDFNLTSLTLDLLLLLQYT